MSESVAVSSVPAFIPTQLIPLDRITASPYQARKTFDEDAIRSLARSIELEGLLEPIIVRSIPSPNTGEGQGEGKYSYELIAGERRWRAFKLKG